ncbi:hypothetical protein C8F01DRAFT_423675 [Mycena amicta]|nr:hypothetical protein C8F01DRAFT_423675 [Mycena amicta]
MTQIASAVSDFLSALTGLFFGLLNSVLAFFQAVVVLGKDILGTIVHLAQSLVALVFGLLQGVYGFIAANLLALVVVGGAYYFYTTSNRGRKRRA